MCIVFVYVCIYVCVCGRDIYTQSFRHYKYNIMEYSSLVVHYTVGKEVLNEYPITQ